MRDIPKEHLLKYIGGEVDVEFKWVPAEEGENDLHQNKEERKRRWDNHRRLCNEYEKVTRRWAASKGKEGKEERRILQKKLRLSHFDYEPYWLGRWVHHRNGDLPMGNPGIVRWEYPYKDGKKVREILGHEDSRKSVLRELQEIAVGAPVDFVEARTKQLLKEDKWGKWDTCDDLPKPPSGFKDGQLIYEGSAAASIDVIGLNGPETLEEAKKVAPTATHKEISTSTDANAVPAANGAAEKTEANDNASSGSALVKEKPFKSSTQAQSQTPKEPEKQSLFSSLKKKLTA